ncbi:alpha-ketoglutarate-dependent dioxygenase AlkB family protein [Algibacter aquimarinus]|uniref:Alpha-ketoglutarate-dependent dioxygenase AlkB n=1 Tax=Algibacter aquimarinus TaxID=1136748 RepID=A0ABP9H142_9FLAO
MLFSNPINLEMKDGNVVYYPNFFNKNQADIFFENLLQSINWQQDNITVFGKTYLQPRLTAFYADNSKNYKYSNITMKPHHFSGDLLKIKTNIETKLDIKFTSCLANLYRDGNDSNGWHADDEKELGINPIIASISFGEKRVFHFKHRYNKELKKKLVLDPGSLLLMKGATQENWLHQIPKTKKQIGERINLTFRIIK